MCSPSRTMAAISGQRTSRSTSGSWKPTLSGRCSRLVTRSWSTRAALALLRPVGHAARGLRLLDLVGLDDVALLELLVAIDPDAALEPGDHFLDVVFETLQPGDLAFVNLFVVAQQLRHRATGDLSILHPRASDNPDLRNPDRRQHFGSAFPDLHKGRLIQTLDGALDVVGDVVDDVVTTDIDLLAFGRSLCLGLRPHIEGDDQRIRNGGE